MSLKVVVVLYLVTKWCRCMTELEEKCTTDYKEEFNNDFLLGTWYYVRHFNIMISLLPATECPTFTYTKPNSTELRRYQEEYLKPDSPYSVTDNWIIEDGGYYHPKGILIGNKQAKFFVLDPKGPYYMPPLIVRVYRRISEEFVLYNDCSSRMHYGWLLSRTRDPSPEKVDAAIKGHDELRYMKLRVFCSLT